MAYDASVFNVDPYYDDYSDDKKFLRILYKPGVAVQARELTQSQTILQTQIQRFGDNIFKDGSIVTESQVVLNPTKFIRISNITGYAGVALSNFDGLTAAVSGKNTIKVIDFVDSLSGSNSDNTQILLYSEYLGGATGFAIGDTLQANYLGTTIYATVTGGTATPNYYAGAPTILPAFGNASVVGIDSGVRYIKGYFVNHDAQKITPYNTVGSGATAYRIFNSLNSTIKLDVTNTIVTATDDNSLNDPAFGSYNYAAPGGDRYRLDLTLNHLPLSATADYTLINIKNGEATYKVNYPEYNVLADTLARRTYDESGNYTVDDFPITVVDDPDDETKLNVVVGKGKAYIFGYEFINFSNQSLPINKARTLKTTSSAQDIPTVIGNGVNVTFNGSLTHAYLSSINFNGGPLFFLGSGTAGDPCNTPVGTARIGRLNIMSSGATSVNVYDYSISPGFTSGSPKKMYFPGYTGPNQHLFTFTDSPIVVSNTNYNQLVFPVSNDVSAYAVFGLNQQQFIVQKSFVKTIPTPGSYSIYTSDFGFPTETWNEFNSINDVKLLSVTGAPVSISLASFGANNREITFTPGSTGAITIFANINVNETSAPLDFLRTKTSTEQTANLNMRVTGIEEYAYLNGVVDVYSIVSITGQFGAGSQTAMTNYFDLDTGQKDHIYDWSRLVLKKDYFGQGVTAVSATFKKFARSGTDGPFIMDSYGSTSGLGISGYKEIPVYSFAARSGKTVSLAGCYDFRPDRTTPSGFTGTDFPQNYGATGSLSQINDVVINASWNYYLPRTDKLVLTKDKEFVIVTGAETEQAPSPEDSSNAMTLGTVFMNPFTKAATDTIKSIVKNRRYTMKDIGNVEKRVERLEYYTTLSLSEKDAKNLEIQDANGLNKFKNGIFVDDFVSRSNSNYTNVDHLCAIDPERKEARPRFLTKYVDLGLTGNIPSGLTSSPEGIITLNYTIGSFVSQPLASKSVNVNPYNVTNFVGSLVLSPESDDWVDTTRRPDVLINLQGQNDGIADGASVDFGTVWNNWETTWTGRTTGITEWNTNSILAPAHSILAPDGVWRTLADNSRLAIQETAQFRTGEKLSVSPETVTRSIGDRIVDVSIIPFMRTKTVTITATGMRPNVRVYPFFDNTDISTYCTVNGVPGASMVTDNEGRIGYATPVTFVIPAGIFRTGERVLRLIDDPSNIVANCTTSADKIYRAQGLVRTEEGTSVSTRTLNIKRESVTDERVFNNVISQSVTQWIDPISQTFLIDPITYPSGIFLKKVTLYFKSKSSTLPINVQIRPTANGYPSSSTVVPFSDVYLSPSSVNISDDGTTGTDFAFTSPVFLQPGEYALTVLSNSNDYEVWVAEIGQDDTITGDKISAQPYGGSFFKSQNSSTWTAEQSLDLKFDISKCNFTYDVANSTLGFSFVETDFNTGYSFVTNGANIFRLNSTTVVPANTTIDYYVAFESGGSLGSDISIQNNQNYVFSTKQNISSVLSDTIRTNLVFGSSSTTPDVSPIVDIERISGLYIQNLMTFPPSGAVQDLYENISTTRGVTDSSNLSTTRYITKKVNLQQGFESDSMDVYLSARLPLYSDIRVYLKSQATTDNTSFDSIRYEPLTIHPNYAITYGSATGSSRYVSNGPDDYVDLRFTRGGTAFTSGVTGQSEFKSFQVKVVLYGDTTNSIVPGFKNLKVLAT